jgi:V/A-type H+-transporting ATPase subunit C
MSSDFGYINARVRGMKSRLLGPEFYSEALNASDFKAFLSTLAQSPYLKDVEEAQAQTSGLAVVDVALARNFYRTTRSILDFSDGTPHDLIALLLLRFDLSNLKAIARAKHAGREEGDIRAALMPAGELKPGLLEALAGASDIPAVAQALAPTRHPLAAAFSRAASRYASDGDLYGFELALDRAYYAITLEVLERLGADEALKRHIEREIDAVNLRTAMKLRGRGGVADEFFIPGGREIAKASFEAMLQSEGQAALQEAVSGTSFAAVADTDSVSAAEAAIREVLDKSAKRLALRDPLGIGVVLHYLRQKEAETARLRLLARGKFYGVERGALERELGHA